MVFSSHRVGYVIFTPLYTCRFYYLKNYFSDTGRQVKFYPICSKLPYPPSSLPLVLFPEHHCTIVLISIQKNKNKEAP